MPFWTGCLGNGESGGGLTLYGHEVKLGTITITRKERDAKRSGVVPTGRLSGRFRPPHPKSPALTAFFKRLSAQSPLPGQAAKYWVEPPLRAQPSLGKDGQLTVIFLACRPSNPVKARNSLVRVTRLSSTLMIHGKVRRAVRLSLPGFSLGRGIPRKLPETPTFSRHNVVKCLGARNCSTDDSRPSASRSKLEVPRPIT